MMTPKEEYEAWLQAEIEDDEAYQKEHPHVELTPEEWQKYLEEDDEARDRVDM